MQWKRAHVVLMCTKGPNNNSLQGYILVYYYAEEAGEIVLGIEVARELEMIFCYFYILKSVKSVDTQPVFVMLSASTYQRFWNIFRQYGAMGNV